MAFIKFDSLKFKNACLIRSNLLIPIIKAVVLFALWQGLKSIVILKDLWIVPIWIALGFAVDGFLIVKKLKIFEDINLTEDQQKEWGMNSEEFIRYLSFSPKIRLGRTLISIFFTLVLCFCCGLPDWSLALMVGLFLGFIILDPILKYMFNIKTPLIYKNSHYRPYKPIESLQEMHKFDISWAGSQAWTALRNTRQFDHYPYL
jgi:hypothetical protein